MIIHRVCFLNWMCILIMRLCLSNTSKAYPTNAYLKINVSSGIATSESIIFQAQILFVRCWIMRCWGEFMLFYMVQQNHGVYFYCKNRLHNFCNKYFIHWSCFGRRIPVELDVSYHEQSTAKVHNLPNFIVLPSFHWHV
jgi:hypothetical protein